MRSANLIKSALGVAVVGGFVVVYWVVSSRGAATGRASAQERAAPPPTEAAQAPKLAVVALDLADSKRPLRVSAPSGQVSLELRNALPMGPYRVSIQTSGFPPLPHSLTPSTDFAKYVLPKDCGELAALALPLFRVSDEESVAAAAAALESSSADCSAKRLLLDQSLSQTRPPAGSFALNEGEEVGVRVERLDAQGQVVRTWSATVVGRVPDRGWKAKSEEEWIVHEVRLNVAQLVAAANGEALPQDIPAKAGFKPAPHVWAPEAYVEDVGSLRPDRNSTGAAPSGGPQEALLELRASVIEAQNAEISSRLEKNFRDPETHEQAAFLLGVFALREAAGSFSDTRPALSRMTAHLAFASALRQGRGPGVSARLATVLLSTLVGRQREALDALARMTVAPKSPEAVWRRCLQTENDGDWRRLSAKGPLLERLALFRALSTATSPHKAVLTFGADSLEPIPDWGRIAFEKGASIEVANLFIGNWLPLELAEAASLHGAPTPGDPTSGLTRRWGPIARSSPAGVEVRVLDDGAWSEFAARHVLFAAFSLEDHLENGLGLPGDAKRTADALDRQFGTLALYPFVRLAHSPTEDCRPLAAVIAALPERISATNWWSARARCQMSMSVPALSAWFVPTFPTGTAFDADHRLQSEARERVDLAEAERLHNLAPFAPQVVDTWVDRRFPPPARATVAQRAEAYGASAAYRADVLQQILSADLNDPHARVPVARKLCALDSDTCTTLAWLLAGSGDGAGAADAYRRAFASMDEVSASHDAKWLVDYEFGRGHRDDAKALAERMANTGSGAGLDTMGWFYERTGDLAQAQQLYQTLAQRYNDTASLDGLYVRRSIAGDASYAKEEADAIKRLFPFGLERLDKDQLEDTPMGIQIVEADEALLRGGLGANDIIVGVDGYRIRDADQWETIRQLKTTGALELYAWHWPSKSYVAFSYPAVGMRNLAAPIRSQMPASQQFDRSRSGGMGVGEWTAQAIKGGPEGEKAVLHIITLIAGNQAKASALRAVLRDAPDDMKLFVLGRLAFGLDGMEMLGPELVSLAEHGPMPLRAPAILALGRGGGKSPPALALFVRALDDPEPNVRGCAAQALPFAGPGARDQLPKLREMMKQDPDLGVRRSVNNAIETIERMMKAEAAAPSPSPRNP